MTVVKVGLTGGIGSGKTTVVQIFEKSGIPAINADGIARNLTRPGSPYHERIAAYFGTEMLCEDGSLDRSRISERIFADSACRDFLESLLHPPIRRAMHEWAETLDACYCIMEIPLLIETGQIREMDRVIVVTCPVDIRRARLEQHRGLDPEVFNNIIKIQLSDEQRIRHADDIISNDLERGDLELKVQRLHALYASSLCD